MRDLSSCQWVRKKHNVIVVGNTGVGKCYLGAALAQAACRNGFRALCTRVPRLLHELAIARADGTYTPMLARLAKLDVLVLDDLLIAPLKDTERRDLLEVLEDRYGASSTVVTTQLPTKNWHERLADPTLADAICDRVVHNAHVIALKGPSSREKKGLRDQSRLNPQREPSPVASLRHQTDPVASLRRRPGQPEPRPDHAGTAAQIDRNTQVCPGGPGTFAVTYVVGMGICHRDCSGGACACGNDPGDCKNSECYQGRCVFPPIGLCVPSPSVCPTGCPFDPPTDELCGPVCRCTTCPPADAGPSSG